MAEMIKVIEIEVNLGPPSGAALDRIAEAYYNIKRNGRTDKELLQACTDRWLSLTPKPAPAPKPSPYAGRECPCGKLPPRDGLPGCEYHHVER